MSTTCNHKLSRIYHGRDGDICLRCGHYVDPAVDRKVWSDKAVLAGDLVLWPDDNKYPAFVPVASAKHPNFDGTIVVLAGNRHIIVSLCKGAKDAAGVRKKMSAKGDAGP